MDAVYCRLSLNRPASYRILLVCTEKVLSAKHNFTASETLDAVQCHMLGVDNV